MQSNNTSDEIIGCYNSFKHYPLRNSNGVPGFSDHFPVYVYLIREQGASKKVMVNYFTKKEIKFNKTKEGKIEVPCTVNDDITSFIYEANL